VEEISLLVAAVLLTLYIATTWLWLQWNEDHDSDDEKAEAWSLARSLTTLALATAVTAVVTEILVGSLESFARAIHLGEFFVAAVIVAIVGNAARARGRARDRIPRRDQARF
jgi:Ca2+:H+ antiporter